MIQIYITKKKNDDKNKCNNNINNKCNSPS